MSKAYVKQQEALDRSIDKHVWAFFCEPGTGKTFMSIKTVEHWYAKGVNTVFIVCPKSGIFGIWTAVELPKHSTVEYNVIGWKNTFSNGDKDNALRKLNDPKLLYIIVNHDAVATERFKKLCSWVMRRREVGWIYDESTAIKSPKAARTKDATALAIGATYKRILTGTPITEGPLDVFSQTEFLQEGILGFRSYYGMKTRYCEMRIRKFGHRSFNEVVGYRDLDDLRRRLDHFSSFIALKDIAEIPEQSFIPYAIEWDEQQKKYYEEMKAKAFTYIDDNEITAVNVLALWRKLHQIAVGQIKTEDGRYLSVENNRLDALDELLTEKALIWSCYVNSTTDILKRLGDRAVAIRAEDSASKREDTINQWRTNPGIQGLVLNQASAAHGLTLNEAKLAIFYSQDFSLEKRLQALRRNFRIGQDQKTRVIDFYIPKTIEVKIMKDLVEKREVADTVTRFTKQQIKDAMEMDYV